MTIGDKIKIKRLEKGLRQEDLAALSGLSTRSICFWETGRRCPRLPHLMVIADALGVDFMEFVKGVEL